MEREAERESMTQNKTRRPLAEMREYAEALVRELTPYCMRIEVAGSIRRGERLVADIELITIPKWGRRTDALFDTMQIDQLDAYLNFNDQFRDRFDRNHRSAWGPRFKRMLWLPPKSVVEIAIDLFCVIGPAQFGVIFLIRTGPARFSRKMVMPRAYGGALPIGYYVKDGQMWRGDVSVPVPEERDYFAICNMNYVPPEERR